MPIKPANLAILHYPSPVLRDRAKPVPRIDDEVRAVAARMVELMKEVKGLGLAAPQVGLPWRMFVTDVPDEGETRVFINPSLGSFSKETDVYEEGCLSLPGIFVDIERPRGVTISATDLEGNLFTITSNEFAARVWQHEFDHLNGTLIFDRADPEERKALRQSLKMKSLIGG